MGTIRRRHLRKDEIKEIAEKLPLEFQDLGKSLRKSVELLEAGDARIIISNNTPLFLLHDGNFYPLLTSSLASRLPKVVIDMGAVPRIANGADVMCPGIVAADEKISPGQAVVVVDEKNRKELAVGVALIPGREMRGKSGKAVKNVHHVGDRIWKLLRSLNL